MGRRENDGAWPPADEEYAVRGFIPFQAGATDVEYALNVDFQIITTIFHNWVPEAGWNFQERDQYASP